MTRSKSTAKPTTTGIAKQKHWFDPLLALIPGGKGEKTVRRGEPVYEQGQIADAVYFVREGKVRLSVLSKVGQEAILGVLAPGEFCGEGCLSAQPLRVGSARALTAASLIRVQKVDLVKALHDQHPLSEAFLSHLLARNISLEEDICDQLFNHSEKRLARVLLKLARFGQEAGKSNGHTIAPRVSQAALAKMVGTTRSRINFFMNKFRRLGLIGYADTVDHGEIQVHPELLTDIVLSE